MVSIGPSIPAVSPAVHKKRCDGCERPFESGQRMTAIKYGNGEPAGWHCDICMSSYDRWGKFDPERAEREARDA